MYEQSLTTFPGEVGQKSLKQQLQAFCGCSWLPSGLKIVYIFDWFDEGNQMGHFVFDYNITYKWMNGYAWNFKDGTEMSQDTVGSWWGWSAFFSLCVCVWWSGLGVGGDGGGWGWGWWWGVGLGWRGCCQQHYGKYFQDISDPIQGSIANGTFQISTLVQALLCACLCWLWKICKYMGVSVLEQPCMTASHSSNYAWGLSSRSDSCIVLVMWYKSWLHSYSSGLSRVHSFVYPMPLNKPWMILVKCTGTKQQPDKARMERIFIGANFLYLVQCCPV